MNEWMKGNKEMKQARKIEKEQRTAEWIKGMKEERKKKGIKIKREKERRREDENDWN